MEQGTAVVKKAINKYIKWIENAYKINIPVKFYDNFKIVDGKHRTVPGTFKGVYYKDGITMIAKNSGYLHYKANKGEIS